MDGFSSFSSGSRSNTKDAADNDKYLTLEVSVTGYGRCDGGLYR